MVIDNNGYYYYFTTTTIITFVKDLCISFIIMKLPQIPK